MSIADVIPRVLEKVPAWRSRAFTVTPLEGGITNRNFKVVCGGEAFVLRIAGEGTELLGIDRRREHAASVAAAECGVGAEVVAFVESENAMITRFIEGSPLTVEAAAQPDTLRRIVSSIRRYHGGPRFPGSFGAPAVVRSYHRLALGHGVVFPESVRVAFDLLERIDRALGLPPAPVPCHNDLLAANFLDDGATIRILDWEYAAMGDPFFDLGNFAVNQRLGPIEREILLESYLGRVTPRDRARLELMRLLSDLRESFWGFLQSGVSKLDFDFGKYALDHLGRFLDNAAVAELEEWLRAARA